MAWIDDRVWCHPKFTELSGNAGWVWTKGCAYSCGFGTRGHLTVGQLRTIGADPKSRKQLVESGLWIDADDGGIDYRDWDEHNGKRDDRRERERERKREARAAGRWNESDRPALGRAPDCAPGEAPARAEGSKGSEGSDRNSAVKNIIDIGLAREGAA